MDVLKKIEEFGIVPVAVWKELNEAKEALGALHGAGLDVAEICFRTDCAEQAIVHAVREYPSMLVGAGTVINAEQCRRAIGAGAWFVVSPGLSESVAKICEEHKILYLPGVVTPTEIMRALEMGISDLKFFPASDFGGLKTIRSLCAAFPQVRFMPTGGVNEQSAAEYLAFAKIFACGGSWITRGSAEEILVSASRALQIAAQARNIEKDLK